MTAVSPKKGIAVDPSALPVPPGQPAQPGADERAFARRVLDAEARAVAGLAARLDAGAGAFERAVTLIVRCADAGGTVLVSGLGKSGLIGAKIAATLTSLGIPSHFVHPTEAAHGDLGNFRPQDICLALSYSGETEEVVALAGLLAQDGVPILAITRGDGASGLERVATVNLAIGAVDEPELSPAPTCSTTATLALGDALALCASRRRNFTDDDFAKRHPGGTLGGLLRPVMEIVRFRVGRDLNAVPHDRSVAQALEQADTGVRRPGALLLVDPASGVLSGIFTDADLRRLVRRNPADLARPVAEFMTRQPSTLSVSALVRDAVRVVRQKRADEIPVVDEHARPVGILDVQDLVAMKVVKE